MDTRIPTSPITSTDSRLSHQNRLHFILFVDASQTRSFSLKKKHAWLLLASVILFFMASLTTAFVLARTFKKLKTTQSYLVDVKRELFAQSVAVRNILSSDFIGGGYNDESSQLIQSIADELAQSKATPFVVSKVKIPSETKTIAKKQATTPSGASDNLDVDLPKVETAALEKAQPISPIPESSTSPLQASSPSSPVRFENVRVSDDEEEPGSINISFDLQNVSGRTLTGWVCAAVTSKSGEGKSALRTAPTSVSLSGNKTIASCKGGEFVKFNRLRPTQLSTSGSKGGVEQVVVYFTDGISGRQYANQESSNTMK